MQHSQRHLLYKPTGKHGEHNLNAMDVVCVMVGGRGHRQTTLTATSLPFPSPSLFIQYCNNRVGEGGCTTATPPQSTGTTTAVPLKNPATQGARVKAECQGW